MNTTALFLALVAAVVARADVGATKDWITYEAEDAQSTGKLRGPRYEPFQMETEASQQRVIQLERGQTLAFQAKAEANALIVRYHLADSARGGGLETSLEVLVDGKAVATVPLTSRRMWLYGAYPFSNDPGQGKPRNFFDEARLAGLTIPAGARVELVLPQSSPASCVIDLVDLEKVAPPVSPPAGAIRFDSFWKGGAEGDATVALRAAVLAAEKERKPLYVGPGHYRITGDIVLNSGVTLAGAGMWHTVFEGDESVYQDAARRVRFKMSGDDIHLSDFAIVGRLNYRNDQEPNDGIVGAGCSHASVRRVWVEHTKAGIWIYNGSYLTIEGCRFRNLLADGINLCVGTHDSVIEQCTARGTGDDCFAIWPAPDDQGHVERAKPGRNVIRHCTGQLPFLANGAAVYGGDSNRVEDCEFTDITTGCGILISTTFPTSDDARGVNNNFSGETRVERCRLVRCGGYDHTWAYRGSLQVCADRLPIRGVAVTDVEIVDSFSDGITFVAPGAPKGAVIEGITFSSVTVIRPGIGSDQGRGVFARKDARGGVTFSQSDVGKVVCESPHFSIETK